MKTGLMYFAAGAMSLAIGLGVYWHQQKDFTVLDGNTGRWQDYHGEYVVINYFAEWCVPCLREVPELNAFAQYASAESGVSLFAISFDDLDNDSLRAIRDKYNMEFDLIETAEANMPNPRPGSLPATFIIGPDGKVLTQLLGEQSSEKLQARIAQLKGL